MNCWHAFLLASSSAGLHGGGGSQADPDGAALHEEGEQGDDENGWKDISSGVRAIIVSKDQYSEAGIGNMRFDSRVPLSMYKS